MTTKAAKSSKKPVKKSTAVKKSTRRSVAVDYEPTKMTVLVSAIAVISLVVLALLATYS